MNNYPFSGEAKRLAFLTATVFLEENGWHFNGSDAEAILQTLALAAGELDEAGFAA